MATRANRESSGLSQASALVIIVLIVLSVFAGYLVGSAKPILVGEGSSSTASNSSSNVTTTITEFKLETSSTDYTQSTTVTATSYEFTLTASPNYNNSISNIVIANITTGQFPQQIAVNSKTNTVYVTYWNGSTYLAVIDGRTNKIVLSLANISNSEVLVNTATNMIFIGNEVINGSTNMISVKMGNNLKFVALDEKRNLLYASTQPFVSGQNGTTTLYEINGTTFDTISSRNYTGQLLGGFVFDSNTSTLFATDCTESFACSPSYIVAINGSTLDLESKLQVNEIFFATAFDPQENLIYVTALQNLLLVINGTNDQLVAKVPVTAFANEFEGIVIDPFTSEIFLTGAPYCSGFPECFSNTLYVLSSTNYGLFATFISNNTLRGPIVLQFDPANNETYMGFGFSQFRLGGKSPSISNELLGSVRNNVVA